MAYHCQRWLKGPENTYKPWVFNVSEIATPTKPSITWRCSLLSFNITGGGRESSRIRWICGSSTDGNIGLLWSVRNSPLHFRTFMYNSLYCCIISKSSAGRTAVCVTLWDGLRKHMPKHLESYWICYSEDLWLVLVRLKLWECCAIDGMGVDEKTSSMMKRDVLCSCTSQGTGCWMSHLKRGSLQETGTVRPTKRCAIARKSRCEDWGREGVMWVKDRTGGVCAMVQCFEPMCSQCVSSRSIFRDWGLKARPAVMKILPPIGALY